MKLIGLVGNNAKHSYNRMLLQYMAQEFGLAATIEIHEINELPLFSEDSKVPDSVLVLSQAIAAADGIIIATPEYDHAIPACLKSCLEWLSSSVHPFTDKAVMIVGTSLGQQGTSFAQTQLREILNAPGVNARLLSGNQFMLGFAKEQFDNRGNLINQKTVTFLAQCFDAFQVFVRANLVTQ